MAGLSFQFLIGTSTFWMVMLFAIGFVAFYKSGRWLETLRLQREKGLVPLLKGLYTAFSIFNKPMITTYDLWSDIALCLEMYALSATMPMYCCISVLIFHAIASSVYLSYDSYENHEIRGALQFFNLLIFYETYNSVYAGHGLYELQEVRILEVCFESGPQAIIQIYFALEYIDNYSQDPLFLISILFTMISLTAAIHFLDCYGLATAWQINFGGYSLKYEDAPVLKFVCKALVYSTRMIEVCMRLLLISYAAEATITRVTYSYIVCSAVIVFTSTFWYRCSEGICFMSREEILREIQISLLNVYFFHWENKGVFLITNIWKVLENIVFLMLILVYRENSEFTEYLLLILPCVFAGLCLLIYFTPFYDFEAFQLARDQNIDALFDAKHFELLERMLKRGHITEKLEKEHIDFFKMHGVRPSVFREGNVGAVQMRKFGFTAQELWNADYTKKELQLAGYSDVLITVVELRQQRLVNNRTASDVREAGHSIEIVIEAGYTREEILNAEFNAHDLRRTGFTAQELWIADYTKKELQFAGYSDVVITALELRQQRLVHNRTVSDVREAGHSIEMVIEAGYTREEILNAEFSAHDLRRTGFTIIEMRKHGYSMAQARAANFTPLECREAGYTDDEILRVDYPVSEIDELGFSIRELLEAGYSRDDIVGGTYTAKELHDENYTVSEIRFRHNLQEIRKAGYDASEVMSAGFTIPQVKAAHYTVSELFKVDCSASDLIQAGFTPTEFRDSGFEPAKLREAGFTIEEMRAANYTSENILRAGFSVADLRKENYSLQEILSTGFRYNEEDILKSGFTATELQQARYKAKKCTEDMTENV